MSYRRGEFAIGRIFCLDTGQFGLDDITGVFCYWDGNDAILMDTGTSSDVDAVLHSMEAFGISIDRLAGLTFSHYHFDHAGGCCELWKRMKDVRSDFRIYTNIETMNYLRNPGSHMKGAASTFGSYTGTMDEIPERAFCVTEYDGYLPLEFRDGDRIKLVHTPGHTHDHSSPALISEGRVLFLYAGEALGTLHTADVKRSSPSSMPPNFHYGDFIRSIEKIRELRPEHTGLSHYGVISGAEDLGLLLDDQLQFMERFRDEIARAYAETSSTAHVLKRTDHLWDNRLVRLHGDSEINERFLKNIKLALTYGVMVDLGLKKSRYEPRSPLLSKSVP